jgi:hypothetical protein
MMATVRAAFNTGFLAWVRALTIVGVLVLLALAAGFAGLGDARQSLAGGVLADFWQISHFVLGVVASVVLGVAALRRRHQRLGLIIAFGLAVGWLAWIAGNAIAIAQGPGVQYAGSARIIDGSQILGEVPINCNSVVGDPTLLAGLGVQTNGFELDLRNRVDRSLEPSISAFPSNQSFGGSTVFFGAVDHVVADGLNGTATIASIVTPASGGPGASTEVTIEWTCDPATRTVAGVGHEVSESSAPDQTAVGGHAIW